MIIEKRVGEINTLKLVTGEEVIARLENQDGLVYKLHKPVVLSLTQQGLAMTPFMLTAKMDSEVTVPKTAVVALALTEKTMADQYISGTTGIAPVRLTDFKS